MKKHLILILSLFFLITSCAVLQSIFSPRNSFDSSRVHLVDQANNNWLFRGNAPFSSEGDFDYESLVSTLKSVAVSANKPLPDKFFMYDVSLLDIEKGDIAVEKSYFYKNPADGRFIHYPIFGDSLPAVLHLKKIDSLLSKYVTEVKEKVSLDLLKGDKISYYLLHINNILPLYTQQLRSLVENSHDYEGADAAVIYVHCEAGCDRTGEIIANYRMEYLNFTVADAWQKDVEECGRAPNYFALQSIKLSCYRLKAKGLPVGDCVGFRIEDYK